MKNSGRIYLIFVALVVGSFSQRAESAGVVLRSDTFAKICKVEVSKGRYADRSQNVAVFSGAVERGWSYQTHDADYLCYRRSTDPLNCWSEWTAYQCVRWTMDGQISFPLQ